jgi:hypothetical protein
MTSPSNNNWFKTPLQRARERKAKTECRWFLRCENPATTTRKHPILGDVPICERCNSKMKEIVNTDD